SHRVRREQRPQNPQARLRPKSSEPIGVRSRWVPLRSGLRPLCFHISIILESKLIKEFLVPRQRNRMSAARKSGGRAEALPHSVLSTINGRSHHVRAPPRTPRV